MRRPSIVLVSLILVTAPLVHAYLDPIPLMSPPTPHIIQDACLRTDIGDLADLPPLTGQRFLENRGQLGNADVLLYADGGSLSAGFAEGRAIFLLKERAKATDTSFQPPATPGPTPSEPRVSIVSFSLVFEGCNAIEPRGIGPLDHSTSFFLGNDPSRWVESATSYSEVLYEGLWDAIDLRFYFLDGMLKYDLVVRPGGEVPDIRMSYEGVEGLGVDGRTDELVIRTALGIVRDTAPTSYQDSQDGRVDVQASFRVLDERTVGFRVGAHHPGRPLIIDPGLVYSTFIGGTGGDGGPGYDMLCEDASGHLFMTGITYSLDFPTTTGVYNDTNNNASKDIIVMKWNISDMELMYSTYVGGKEADTSFSICIDDVGNAYVSGDTRSTEFPTTAGAYDTTYNGHSDIFVFKLDATGSDLIYSTYMGGETRDYAYGMCLNATYCPYVVGPTSSSDFPTTAGAYDRTYNGPAGVWSGDGYIFALNATGASLAFSTFVGDTVDDWCNDVTIDDAGDVYVTGCTESANFPTTSGAYDTSHNGDVDIFILKMDPACSSLKYSTFIGGSDFDGALPICVDGNDEVLVAGITSSINFPTSTDAYDTTYGGGPGDCIALRINISSSKLIFSTFLGGSAEEGAMDMCVDGNGSAYVLGYSRNTGYPTSPGAYDEDYNGGMDVVLSKLAANGTGLEYSTYLGGASDEIGNCMILNKTDHVWIAGGTGSGDFPVTTDAFDTHYDGGDIFLTLFQVVPINATPPSAPRNLTATPTDETVTLAWEPPEDDGGIPVKGYSIFRGPSDEALTLFTVLGPDARNFVNHKLVNGRQYHYAINAYNFKGPGPLTPAVNATPRGPPSAVLDLTAQGGLGNVSLNWTPPNDTGGAPLSGYVVWRSTDGLILHNIAELGNVTGYIDTDVTSGVTYYYKVRAFTTIGDGDLSDFASAIPYGYPGAPRDLRAIPADGRISLSWQPPEETGGRPLEGYRLFKNISGEPLELMEDLGGILSYLDEQVINGVEYHYAVRAVNLAGEGPYATVGPVMPVGLPDAPEDLSVIAGDGMVSLSWGRPLSTGGLPILDYVVYRGGSPTSLAPIERIPDLSFVDLEVRNGETYYYHVRARTLIAEGPPTPTLSAVPVGLPDAPGDLVAVAGIGKVELQWTPPGDTGGSSLTGYELMRGDRAGALELLRTLGPFSTRFTDTGVVNGTTYHYAIVALTEVGRSPQSKVALATPFGLPGTPEGLSAAQEVLAVALRWTAPTQTGGRPIISYRVYRGVSAASLTLLAELGNKTVHSDVSARAGDTYYYVVTAVNEAGEGGRSDVATVHVLGIPGAPQSVKAIALNGTVVLSWLAPESDGGTDVTGHIVLRGTIGGNLTVIATIGPVMTFTDADVTPGTSYRYSIIAVNSIGEGPSSNPVLVKVPEKSGDEKSGGFPLWLMILIVAILVAVSILALFLRSRKTSQDKDV